MTKGLYCYIIETGNHTQCKFYRKIFVKYKIKGKIMKTTIKLFLVLIMSTIVNASSHMVPIIMDDTISFVPTVSVSTEVSTYPANATVTVNVNGTLSNNKDWIGVFKKGTQKKWGNQIAWNFLEGKHSVALTTNKKPMPEGAYEVALFFNNSFDAVEASASFDVYSKPTISIVSKTANKPVTVNVQGKLSGHKDWAGIYKKGDDNTWGNVLAWGWIKNRGKHVLDEIDPVVMPAGQYEARLFYNNSFRMEAKTAFSVAGKVEAIGKVQNAGANKVVTVTVNKHHIPKDWVGIFKKGVEKKWGNQIAWSFVEGKNRVTINPGNKLPAGEYEVALFLDNSLDKVEFSVGFVVRDGGNGGKVYPPETTLTPIKVDPIERPAHKFDHYEETAFDNTVTRTVTRITDREHDNKGMNNHQYPKHGSAWNSDMSLLRLTGRIYDAETLREIPLTKDKSSGEVNTLMKAPESLRWSKNNPNVLYVMSGGDNAFSNKFYELTINVNRTEITSKVIYDLGTINKGHFRMGHGEGNIDYADRYVVLSATNGNDIYATLLDIKEKHLVWGPKKVPLTKDYIDWISISPSGNYILVSSFNKDKKHGGDGTSQVELYNRNFEKIRVLANNAGHGDIGRNDLKEDVYVQWEQDGYSAYNLKTKETIQLLDFKVGSAHVSCRNHKRKGWCYISSSYKGFREIFALKLDESKKVQRFAKSYARGDENGNNYIYSKYPTGIPSPDGTRVLFWSDYGNPEGYTYRYMDNKGDWHTTDHYYKRDTYQVRISQ